MALLTGCIVDLRPCVCVCVAEQADSAACHEESQALQRSLHGSVKQATSELAGSRSSVQGLAQQLDQHAQDVDSKVQQQVQVSTNSRDGCIMHDHSSSAHCCVDHVHANMSLLLRQWQCTGNGGGVCAAHKAYFLEAIVSAVGWYLQAMCALASNGSAKVAAESQAASQQLEAAMLELQNSRQALAAAAEDSSKADAAVATSLSGAAAAMATEASGVLLCC